VLLNLLSNAAKFTNKGVISLLAARHRTAAGDWIDIQVKDTGIGISKTDMEKLFKNFGQATAETSKKYGGTGLGLVISRQYCALMGGGITVTSELGRGSCFSVRILANCADDRSNDDAVRTAPTPVAAPAYAS
jgi:signal transduction histidine kinase